MSNQPPPLPQPKPVKDWPDNDEELLELGGGNRQRENYWALQDAFEGTQVVGAIGSGKTSGSGQAIARAFLEANLGGLVLTAKTDETQTWRKYARATGREPDLIVVDEENPHRFNFLRYELERPGRGGRHTENLVSLFCAVVESGERKQGQNGSNEGYWQRTMKQLLRSAIDLSVMAANDVDLPTLHRIITTAPRSLAEAEDQKWQENSACFKLLQFAKREVPGTGREDDFELTYTYWLNDFPGLAADTRSIVVSSFTSMADCFLRGMLRKLFCTERNFSPEDSFEGKIIILNLPVKEYNEVGQFAQSLFKFVWQRAVERRIPENISPAEVEQTIRPVFLWADESQFFANSYDALFQSTARSSRACTVYLTQNIPSYSAAFGGGNARSEVEAFLGNLQTKVMHANGDATTNKWAAETIGRTQQIRPSGGMSESLGSKGGSGNMQQNSGGSMEFQYLVQPQEFTTLATGGKENGCEVGAVIFQGGRQWLVADKKGRQVWQNFIRHSFPQIYP